MHVALLRAINVGGRNQIAMAELRELVEGLGCAGTQSLLQSGNLTFRSNRRDGAALERLLETATEKCFGFAIDYLVRTAEEWNAVIEGNPFPDAAKKDPSHLLVTFLKKSPEVDEVRALQAAIQGPESVRAEGRHLYAIYPAGVGRSKLTNTLIERKLGTRGTARNWNTVLKLAEMVRE